MLMRKLLLGSLTAVSLGSLSLSANARTDVDVYLNFGPPAVRYEYAPAPRYGYAWVPGYWDWRYHRHHWVPGHWVRHRPGYSYHAPRWVYNDDGRWQRHRGQWARDRDRYVGNRDYRYYR